MTAVRRIAIIGAECVGKTELARQLAALLPGLWVPEYLREFCDRLRRTPLPHEQAHILGEQRRREDDAVAAAREQRLGWVLADSSPLVTAVYSELLFDDRALYAPAAEHHAVYARGTAAAVRRHRRQRQGAPGAGAGRARRPIIPSHARGPAQIRRAFGAAVRSGDVAGANG